MKLIQNTISSLTAAFALAMLIVGCAPNQEQMYGLGRADYICFEVIDGSVATKADARQGFGDHLFSSEEDWPVEGIAVPTRGNPTTAFAGYASLIGFLYNGAWDGSQLPWSEMYKKEFNFNGGEFTAVSDPIPWVKARSFGNLRVYAYAPHDFDCTVSASDAAGVPTIEYTVPTNVADQEDLIVATNTVAGNYNLSIPLTFNHALTAVKFNVDFDCTVKSIVVNDVYGHGIYSMAGSWSGVDTETDYAIDLGEGVSCSSGSAVTSGGNTLMLIPQTVPAGATVVMTYNYGSGADESLTANIAGHVWAPGKRITYTISKEAPNYIYFDLAAGNVLIENGMYSGFVYTYNGTVGPVEVSGDHDNNNLYYIYQSTSANRTSTGWAGDVGSTMNLPVYPEARTDDGTSWSTSSGTKTWREFITNNPDIASVIDGWDLASEARGTASTPNTIKINGGMKVNLTVDNIWSSFHENVRHRTSGGLLIGPGGTNHSYRYERVTLRLKGDNRLNNIYYYGHPTSQTGANTAYFKITSADGDGSPYGTLTVTVPNKSMTLNGACNIMGSGDDDECNPCNDMWFYGGTIYAASSLGIVDGDATGVLGGGTNNGCNITFNGGVVTAVAYSNGAAIGGGGGYNSVGGNGTVTINGGKIYAYQFGTVSNNKHQALATAAIGGGSSYISAGNAGTVTINGGEVFAQSIGGVALGGGSSGDVRGGSAIITINGGTVIAKSVTGNLGRNPSYPRNTPGSSIGGGTGGLSASGTGGTAVVTITNGTLLAGSIGGGGTISSTATIGSAQIDISGGDVQGQFIMAAGAAVTPSFTMTGGVIQNGKSGDFLFVKEDGGAVFINDGSFTMSGGTIHHSFARYGGAVYMDNGSFTMTGGSIRDCSATSGGAVYIAGDDNPSFTMSGGEISGCSATSNGGAVSLEGGIVTLTGGSVSHNDSKEANGGGIYINKGEFSMSDGTISGNYANVNGGGVYISSESTDVSASVTGGSITDNAADKWGGGLCVLPGGTSAANVTLGVVDQGLTNPDISDNRAQLAGGGIYAEGTNAHIVINSGKIANNNVSAYVANEDVQNENGRVTLNDGNVSHVVVTFHANGGEGESKAWFGSDNTCTELIQKIVTSTNSMLVTPDASDCHRMGQHFTRWNTRPDGLGTDFTDGQNMNITEDVDLYVIWGLD